MLKSESQFQQKTASGEIIILQLLCEEDFFHFLSLFFGTFINGCVVIFHVANKTQQMRQIMQSNAK